ncbi:DUF2637 domain-containing protein [Actinokineospora bangkokensis]|uniref:DUF2637 domain-containing protein n=1 Tax=Actinokineospora bangkokensis TaxID=1193682 RepID=A0A1Q9LKL0_9PSEU|nr:DUF2637 domain-containing protein [Actinokineospora bangkokensis]OLR92534.1 hypothetical protein BJP25_20955 [Actinokineospora bangkokensis]
MSQESALDPAHALALAGRATIADKIRYACEQVDPPTTHGVQQFLDAYGVTTARSYATNVIETWRRENQLGDTGDLVALSPGLLAELDALRTGTGSSNGSANGATNGSSNGAADGAAKAATNGSANGAAKAATNGSATNGSAKQGRAANGTPAKARTRTKGKSTNGTAAATGATAVGAEAVAADGAAAEGVADVPVAGVPGVDTPADKDTTDNMDTAVETGKAEQARPADATEVFGKVDPAARAAAEDDSPTLVTLTPVRDDADTPAEAGPVDLSWLDEGVDKPEEAGPADEAEQARDADAGAERADERPAGKDLVVAEPAAPPVEPVTAHAERVAAAPVDPSPVAAALPRVPVALSWSANMAWIVVLVAAMGISWWSLFEYARSFSIPTPLAAVVSLVFDASALIVAGLAHRYALSPYSGAGPRIALLLLLAGSCYLNWEHAAGKGYGIEASIMFAAPAAVGILLFELHIGWHSRSERRARGRVARSLPVIGAWGWFLHPLQSVTTLWRVTAARGRSVREAELSSIESARP